ncbi:hypothetical protein Tco_1195673 [Tanacetum coccineum]
MRVSTNAPPSSSTSSSNFEFQQMAAALEDKMILTFRNEINEMKNMMKALVPTPIPIKAVEERCTTCGSNHSYNVCPMNRGAYDYPVYHDNFQKFQQAAAVGGFVQGNSFFSGTILLVWLLTTNDQRGFTQPNHQDSRPNKDTMGKTKGIMGLAIEPIPKQVNMPANLGLNNKLKLTKASGCYVSVAYSKLRLHKGNDAT